MKGNFNYKSVLPNLIILGWKNLYRRRAYTFCRRSFITKKLITHFLNEVNISLLQFLSFNYFLAKSQVLQTWFCTVVVSKCFCSAMGSCSLRMAAIFWLSGTLTLGILSPRTLSSSLITLFLFDVRWLEVVKSFLSLEYFNLSLSTEPALLVTNWVCKSCIREFTSPEKEIISISLNCDFVLEYSFKKIQR